MNSDEETLSAEAVEVAQQKIHPIVEFFPTGLGARDKDFIDTSSDDRKNLRKALSRSKGIYAFYNSELEIIYLGKSKNNLWVEMKNAYNREMGHYNRYSVHHPRGKYSEPSSGKVRFIKSRKFYLYDSANFFSAYAIEDETLIDLFELMMIRIIPNDLLNVRIEGNTSMKVFKSS